MSEKGSFHSYTEDDWTFCLSTSVATWHRLASCVLNISVTLHHYFYKLKCKHVIYFRYTVALATVGSCPSIHFRPSIRFIWGQVVEAAFKGEMPRLPDFSEYPESFPGQPRDIVSPEESPLIGQPVMMLLSLKMKSAQTCLCAVFIILPLISLVNQLVLCGGLNSEC